MWGRHEGTEDLPSSFEMASQKKTEGQWKPVLTNVFFVRYIPPTSPPSFFQTHLPLSSFLSLCISIVEQRDIIPPFFKTRRIVELALKMGFRRPMFLFETLVQKNGRTRAKFVMGAEAYPAFPSFRRATVFRVPTIAAGDALVGRSLHSCSFGLRPSWFLNSNLGSVPREPLLFGGL